MSSEPITRSSTDAAILHPNRTVPVSPGFKDRAEDCSVQRLLLSQIFCGCMARVYHADLDEALGPRVARPSQSGSAHPVGPGFAQCPAFVSTYNHSCYARARRSVVAQPGDVTARSPSRGRSVSLLRTLGRVLICGAWPRHRVAGSLRDLLYWGCGGTDNLIGFGFYRPINRVFMERMFAP